MATGSFKTLLKATRMHRTLTGLSTMTVPLAFANKIPADFLFLCLAGILIYSAAGIHNAHKDGDYQLPSYFKFVIGGLIFSAILVSLSNKIIFLTTLAWLGLGIFYNTLARFILFGDTTILAITHHALPSLSASILLGLNWKLALLISSFMFLVFWFVIHIKNLKGVKEDTKRGYKTIATKFKKSKKITNILIGLAFIIMLSAYFIFNLSLIYLLVLSLVLVLKIIIIKKINNKKEESGLNLMRLATMIFLFGIVIDKASNFTIILFSFFLCFAYFLFLAFDVAKKFTKRIKHNNILY